MQETCSVPEVPVREDASPHKDAPPRKESSPRKDYYARLAARFLKDPLISPDAKLLRALLAAFADERTGRTYVSLRRIQQLMRCGRHRRSAAQNELAANGWLKLIRERAYGGRLGRLTYLLCEPPLHAAALHEIAPAPHSQPSCAQTPHDPAARPPSPKRPPLLRFATVVKRSSPNTSMPSKK